MQEQIARGAARVAELEELVHQADNRRPHADGNAESKQNPRDGLPSARPGELYKAGIFSLLATVQVAWLVAIAYGILILVR
jgi:hypothetical protein